MPAVIPAAPSMKGKERHGSAFQAQRNASSGTHLQKASGPSPVRMITPTAGSSRASAKHHDISMTAACPGHVECQNRVVGMWVEAGHKQQQACTAAITNGEWSGGRATALPADLCGA